MAGLGTTIGNLNKDSQLASLSYNNAPSVIPSSVKNSVIDCTKKAIEGVRDAIGACLIAVPLMAGSAQAATQTVQKPAQDYVVDAAKTVPDLIADLIRQFSLDPATAKIIAELSADNLDRIKRGEITKDDIVLRVRAIDRSNLAREITNNLDRAPLANFSDVTGGEKEITTENFEKVITALFDTSDIAVWLRKSNGDEYTADELDRYRKQKVIDLNRTLTNTREMLGSGDGRAQKLFAAFNADLKSLTIFPSRPAFQILFSNEGSMIFGESVYSGTDDKKKNINAANLTSQMMTRALLTKKDFPAGGVKLLIGKDSQTAVTHMVPTPLQLDAMTKGPQAISSNLASAPERAMNVWTKSYSNAMDPVVAIRKIEKGAILDKDIAILDKDIAKIDGNIMKGKEDIAKIRGNIAKIDGNIAKIDGNIAKIDGNIANITRIGAIRRDINEVLRAIIKESDPINQKTLIYTFNEKMKEFEEVRFAIERNNSDKKTLDMIASINADIAIIRSHPGLKPFDAQLAKFALTSR